MTIVQARRALHAPHATFTWPSDQFADQHPVAGIADRSTNARMERVG
jgi:hypothetical protein